MPRRTSLEESRTTDRISRLAQGAVRTWLEADDLIPHPPDSDQLGWDFFVEFRQPLQNKGPLDQQGGLIKALIQVKSTRRRTEAVRGKLSAFKHLVDADLPAFVCMLEYKANESISRVRILHFGEPEIELILKKVREAEYMGRLDLHRTKITLPLTNARILDFNQSKASSVIQSYVESSSTRYIRKKALFREQCGFGPNSRSAAISWTHQDGIKGLLDLSLGYRTSLKLDQTKIRQRRFDIELDSDITEFSGGTLSIEPQSTKSNVTLQNGQSIATLQFDLHKPAIPNLPKDLQYCRLKNDFIDIKLHIGNSVLNLDVNLPWEGAWHLDQILRPLKFLSLLYRKGTSVQIQFDNNSFKTLVTSSPSSEFSASEIVPFAEYLSNILSRFCPHNSLRTNLTDLARMYHSQKGTFLFITAKGEGHSFRIENAPALDNEVRRLIIYFPARLTFLGMHYGIVGRIETTDITIEKDTIFLKGALVAQVHEGFALEQDSPTEFGLSLEDEARRIAHNQGPKDAPTLVLYAQQNSDGTFRLLSPEEHSQD